MILRTKLALGLVLAAAFPTMAQAGPWQRQHPARAEINHRIVRQEVRITHERREGDLTRDEAHALRSNLRDIHQDARADAAANGGHLTREQARDLNQRLNQNSRDIGY